MGFHSFPYFAVKFSFNETEKVWLENALEKLNVNLGHITKEENEKEIAETLKDKSIISPKPDETGTSEFPYFINTYGEKEYLCDLERNLTIYLSDEDQGVYYSTCSDEDIELSKELIMNVAKMLQQFLCQFNRSDTIRLLAHNTNNRDDTDEDSFLFIGGKVTKEKVEILNLLDWIFEGEDLDILPDFNNTHNY